jgi:hypothetical protein
MYQKIGLFAFGTMLFFSACSKFYSPALFQQDIAYQPKPASFDKNKSATYLSGGVNLYSNPDLADFIESTQFNVSKGHVFDHFNLAYGAFGVLGDYQNGAISKGDPYYFDNKFFGAYGGRMSFNTFVTNGRADFRFLGVEAVYSHEFGDYADFRRAVSNQPNFYADTRTDLFTIGLTTEVIFHNRNNPDFQHGIRGFLGTTLGQNQNETDLFSQTYSSGRIFPKVSYFIKFKNYFGTVEAGQNFFVRFGFKFK